MIAAWRGRSAAWLMLVALASWIAPLYAAEYAIGDAPSWIVPIEPGTVAESLKPQATDGTYYLLSDAQNRIVGGERTQYRRYASTATSAEGLASVANLQIAFDPAYQQLVLHSIDVVRNGNRMRKLGSATIRVLQRESELERQVYDGSKLASIFLEDVRVGDVVDYAYSLHGINPVFDGKDFGRLPLRFGVPVGRIHVRLLVPDADTITLRHRNTSQQAVVTRVGALRSHAWQHSDVPAQRYDDNEPSWYDATPLVEWSAYPDWSAVARWAVPLYAVRTPLGAELQAEIARIASEAKSPTERTLAVLRFVQGEIRYLGVFIGPGSHAPRTPSEVFARRFGDCKDKSLLMLSMLAALDIEAHAALVSTRVRRGVREHLASPGSFDHVVVRVLLDGKPYWFDPTQPTQRADLAHLVQSDYDLALLIEPDADALTAMAPDGKALHEHAVHTTLDATAGLDQPVTYTVVTTFLGDRADSFRQTLSTKGRESLEGDYLNFYAAYYPGISVAVPLLVEEDEARNRITTTERYGISGFATAADDAGRLQASIYAPDIEGQLTGPAEPVRSSPLWRSHPRQVTVVTEVLLPEPWTLDAERIAVDDPAFTYARSIEPNARGLVITDTFRSLKDEVPASEVVAMSANLARARSSVSYSLSWDGPDAVAAVPGSALDRINWLVLVIAAMAFAICLWLARLAWNYDPPPIGVAAADAPQGLGGWLVLPGIGLVLSPLWIASSLLSDLDVWAPASWAAFTTFGGDSYHALWAPVLLFDLVFGIGAFVMSLLLLVLFFSRRTSAPRLHVAFLIGLPLQASLSYWLLSAVPDAEIPSSDLALLGRTWLQAVLWSSYLLLSQRVRATFVVRRITATVVPASDADRPAAAPPPLPV